jgi:glycosyltransferase involved in cell wall biosynthesis
VDNSLHEVIVINDGSTDSFTNEVFFTLEKESPYRIIQHDNMGLAKTRNKGLKLANGKYIIPLDADNLLTNGYLTKGVEILESQPEIAVVYGISKLFDQKEGTIPKYPMSLQTLLSYNDIDACSLYRKDEIIKEGGYDSEMPHMGFEDWELWIRLVSRGYKFHYLENTVTQHYRYLESSMARAWSKKTYDDIEQYLQAKHPEVFNFKGFDEFIFSKFENAPIQWVSKLFIRKYFPAWYNRLVEKGKFRKHL